MTGRLTVSSRTALCAVCLLLAASAGSIEAQLSRETAGLPTDTAVPGLGLALLPTETAFALEQLRYDRVREARVAARFDIKRQFHERAIRYPAAEIFLRAFKRERSLEVWVRPEGGSTFELLKTYPICALSGELGPKLRQGDGQTPEGFYQIDDFNPWSDYHLSLHVDYPNIHDRQRGEAGTKLGGDIYIHGGCSSDGCLAVTDEGIRELYWLAVEARAAGQRRIPVHVFPARLEDGDLAALRRAFADRPALVAFWASLKPGYEFFERNRLVPAIRLDEAGRYVVAGAAPPPSAGTPLGIPVRPGG